MKSQQMRYVRLVTPVECGIPDCHEQTQDTIYEDHSHGRYTAIELAPFCAKHKREMERLWKRRYAA